MKKELIELYSENGNMVFDINKKYSFLIYMIKRIIKIEFYKFIVIYILSLKEY